MILWDILSDVVQSCPCESKNWWWIGHHQSQVSMTYCRWLTVTNLTTLPVTHWFSSSFISSQHISAVRGADLEGTQLVIPFLVSHVGRCVLQTMNHAESNWSQACICGQTFTILQGFFYHQCSCLKVKKCSSDTLEKAREVVQARKRRRMSQQIGEGSLNQNVPAEQLLNGDPLLPDHPQVRICMHST